MTLLRQNFFWNTFWGIFADCVRDSSGYPADQIRFSRIWLRSKNVLPDLSILAKETPKLFFENNIEVIIAFYKFRKGNNYQCKGADWF